MDKFSFKSEETMLPDRAAGVFLIFTRSPSPRASSKLLLIKDVLLGSSQIIEWQTLLNLT